MNRPGTESVIAAVQMCSGTDVQDNLRTAERHVLAAARAGAAVVWLPENFAFMGYREEDRLALAESDGHGPIQSFLSDLAAEAGVWVVGGTIPLQSEQEGRCYASCLVFDESGRRIARYDKIHLFDVGVPGSEESYRESRTLVSGRRLVLCDSPVGRVGLSVCYDLRFPEIYRELAGAGAVVLSVPSAFTAATGRAHWHTLVRARAIENLCYVVAPGQGGRHQNGRETWGHTLIMGPWGERLAELADGDGVITATIDTDYLAKLRQRFPALEHRRQGLEMDTGQVPGGSD